MFVIKRATSTQQESGQAVVEFALVLMLVILPFTAVLIDGAMMLFSLVSITNAAREAAHAGSIYQAPTYYANPYTVPSGCNQLIAYDCDRLNDPNTGIIQAEKPFASTLIPFDQCVTTVAYNPADPGVQNVYREMNSMSVTLACPHRFFFGLIGTGQITLTAQSTMKIEPGGLAVPTPTP